MAIDLTQAGFSTDGLERLKAQIHADVEAGRYHGAVIRVARHGALGLDEAIGWADRAARRPIAKDAVFSLFSTTKGMTTVMALQAIEQGRFAFTTRVCEVIPEFSGHGREKIAFHHLLTHTSGLPSVFTPRPGMYIDRLDEIIAAICEHVVPEAPPGEKLTYSPLVSHALLGEAARRTDPKGRSYRQIANEDIFGPIGMTDTSIGVRRDLKGRHIVPDFMTPSPIEHLGHSDLGPNGAFEEEEAEMPWVGAVSTTADLYRFAEMLRRGGELDGARLLSPAILDRAARNYTGERLNELYGELARQRGLEPAPAYLGLGFVLRGEAICRHQFGVLSSPRTFGSHGLGSTLYWVDPEKGLTFACLTHGVMDENDNLDRFQRLSDLAQAAAV
jgi:CubicO group peptidase (beta-lactamase class C family)